MPPSITSRLLPIGCSLLAWLIGGCSYITWTSHGFDRHLIGYVLPYLPFVLGAWFIGALPLGALALLIRRITRNDGNSAGWFAAPAVLIAIGFTGLLVIDPPTYAKHFQRTFGVSLPKSAASIVVRPKEVFDGTAIVYSFDCEPSEALLLVKAMGLAKVDDTWVRKTDFQFPLPIPEGAPEPKAWAQREMFERDTDERGVVLLRDANASHVLVGVSWMLHR